jgi:hypothetical protein
MKSSQQSECCPQICRGWIAPDGLCRAGATPTRHAWRVTPCGRQRGSRQPAQPNIRTCWISHTWACAANTSTHHSRSSLEVRRGGVKGMRAEEPRRRLGTPLEGVTEEGNEGAASVRSQILLLNFLCNLLRSTSSKRVGRGRGMGRRGGGGSYGRTIV